MNNLMKKAQEHFFPCLKLHTLSLGCNM
jgi:hypothetical protein